MQVLADLRGVEALRPEGEGREVDAGLRIDAAGLVSSSDAGSAVALLTDVIKSL